MIFIIFIFFFNFTEIKSFSQISLKVKPEERCPETLSGKQPPEKRAPRKLPSAKLPPGKIPLEKLFY